MDAAFERQLGGDLRPFASRAVPHRNHVLPVKLTPGAQTVLYLRLQSEGTVVAPVTQLRQSASSTWRATKFPRCPDRGGGFSRPDGHPTVGTFSR